MIFIALMFETSWQPCYNLGMKTLQRHWRIVFPLIFAILIWLFSSTEGTKSQNLSAGFADFFHISNALMRKLAHFFLFAGLAYSLSSYFKNREPGLYPNLTMVVQACIIPVAYAAIDEVHQLTISGRNGSVNDVLLDSLAGICGTLAYVAIFCFIRRSRFKNIFKQPAKEPAMVADSDSVSDSDSNNTEEQTKTEE